MATNWKGQESPKYPVGPLGIVAMQGGAELAGLIDHYIMCRRKKAVEANPEFVRAPGYLRDSFILAHKCVRFSNGEGKAIIHETVRGYDIYIITDIGNYSCTFKMFGMECPMSPDDHFQDIKRVIAAISGKARRLTVIMPMLYEGRQHKRQTRESLDCALALQELERLGVQNVITFDAHDPRVQNAIPLGGFESLYPTYQIIRALFQTERDLEINPKSMVVVSPDEGGIPRALHYASMLDLNVSAFYKRRDLSHLENGHNPIIEHEFLGKERDVANKDILVVDDILASGESLLNIARQLKRLKAKRIFFAVTFVLFVDGLEAYHKAYREGLFNRLYATNLTYRRPELKEAEWFVEVDMSSFIAYLIDMLNHDNSISALFDPSAKIDELLRAYQIR